MVKNKVRGLGFEPRLKASKASVLPLDDPRMFSNFYLLFYQKTPLFSLTRMSYSLHFSQAQSEGLIRLILL
jgi:hypothetical protein